jgi:uncharacterized protein YdeI (YjbR/CyaY-like superfamily)
VPTVPYPTFYAKDGAAWRQWLKQHYATAEKIWLVIYHKKSATPSVYYDEAVEEALCFGWIDSKPNKRDSESFYLFFAPRKAGSVWSKLNKTRVEKLIREKRMTKAGLAKIEAAKQDGSWAALDAIETMPPDLQKALQKNTKAKVNFDAFPPGVKKGIYQWIISARRNETRLARIADTVALAAKNIRANQWTPKK